MKTFELVCTEKYGLIWKYPVKSKKILFLQKQSYSPRGNGLDNLNSFFFKYQKNRKQYPYLGKVD